MENRLCYISRCYRARMSAGNKAKTDSEVTLQGMGAVNLGLKQCVSNSKVKIFFYNLAGMVRYWLRVRPGDVVVLQYPVKKYFSFICRRAHQRGARVIALVHDLGEFRRKAITHEQEMARLGQADGVIATNRVMEQWLLSHGLQVKATDHLDLWDYLSDAEPAAREREAGVTRVAYAGSLNARKASWLLKVPHDNPKLQLLVIGKNDLKGLADEGNLKVMGPMESDDFIANVQADLGLVWDGDSVDTCSGNFGEYLRINTPHKVSFYVRAGLPVIVWSQSAMAATVEREGIGIVIDRISDLEQRLPLPEAEMERLHTNVQQVSQRMQQGCYLQEALMRIMKALQMG